MSITESLLGTKRNTTKKPLDGVKRAYTESTRNLNFKGKWASPAVAKKQVGFIGQYNAFTPSEARRLMSVKGVSKVRVARESSVAIYFLTSDPIALMNARSSANEKNARKSGKKYVVRFWWD